MAIADYESMEQALQNHDPEAMQQLANYFQSVTPIETLIRQQYPQMAWALNNPEIGPILRQAANERWDPARLQGAIIGTQWYSNTTAAQREWQRISTEDPASARDRFNQGLNDVAVMARRLGVGISLNDYQRISLGMAAEGWDATRITQEIMRTANSWDPSGIGEIGASMAAVQTRAAQYFVPIGDQGAFEWAREMLVGRTTQDGLDSYLREQARARFSSDQTIVTALDNGATVAQIFEPLRQQTAQLLEIAPDQVNLMDTQWMPLVDSVQSDGVRRPMSLSEAAQHVRSTDQWRGTNQAGQAAAALGETILNTFGEV